MTGVINNQDIDSHSLSLYGLSATSSIFASMFSDADSDSVRSDEIDFDPHQLQTDLGNPTLTQVSLNKMALGSYHGWFYINGQKKYSIPVTIPTAPMIIPSIIIIMIGAATAIAFLEVDKLVKNDHYGRVKSKLQKEITLASDTIANLVG